MQSLSHENFVEIGFIRKSHGYKGHAKVVIDSPFEDFLSEGQFIFLETDGYKIPFQIIEIDDNKNIIVKLEFINSPEDLKPFQKSSIFIIQNDSMEFEVPGSASSHFKGFIIIDEEKGRIGVIDRVESYPQQDMAILIVNKKEILIPLHEDLIVSVDTSEKEILMRLPEGLTD